MKMEDVGGEARGREYYIVVNCTGEMFKERQSRIRFDSNQLTGSLISPTPPSLVAGFSRCADHRNQVTMCGRGGGIPFPMHSIILVPDFVLNQKYTDRHPYIM